jgi:hypothetical protein
MEIRYYVRNGKKFDSLEGDLFSVRFTENTTEAHVWAQGHWGKPAGLTLGSGSRRSLLLVSSGEAAKSDTIEMLEDIDSRRPSLLFREISAREAEAKEPNSTQPLMDPEVASRIRIATSETEKIEIFFGMMHRQKFGAIFVPPHLEHVQLVARELGLTPSETRHALLAEVFLDINWSRFDFSVFDDMGVTAETYYAAKFLARDDYWQAIHDEDELEYGSNIISRVVIDLVELRNARRLPFEEQRKRWNDFFENLRGLNVNPELQAQIDFLADDEFD